MKFCRLEELVVEAVKEAGAPHISFNPFTERMCIKEATRVLKDASYELPEADIRALVQEVHCDLRNAIQALQLRVLGQRHRTKGTGSRARKLVGTATAVEAQSRDAGLNFFHALGKILYNKRFNSRGEEIRVGQQCASPRCFLMLCVCAQGFLLSYCCFNLLQDPDMSR
jgi:hypothetical protein